MTKTAAVARKELFAYLTSPTAYALGVAAVAIYNIFFYLLIDQNREATLRDLFTVMEFLNIFLIPLLTMRLMSEERSQGTAEFLFTTPTTAMDIVIGKFLGAWAVMIGVSSVVWIHFGLMAIFSRPDPMEALSGWIGIVLETGVLTAAGLAVSCWTRHQVVAAAGAMFLFLILFLLPAAEAFVTGPALMILKNVEPTYHLERMTAGFFGLSDLVYYVSGIILWLTIARYSADYRLWS